MERKLFQIMAALTWLALPVTALNYGRAWRRLPMRMAVHFDLHGQPNGWTSRPGALLLALGITGLLLATFTIAGYATSRARSSRLSRWSLIAVFYIVLGLVDHVNRWIVDRSLNPQQPAPVSTMQVELLELHS
jgi:uncharacterized membrane protein